MELPAAALWQLGQLRLKSAQDKVDCLRSGTQSGPFHTLCASDKLPAVCAAMTLFMGWSSGFCTDSKPKQMRWSLTATPGSSPAISPATSCSEACAPEPGREPLHTPSLRLLAYSLATCRQKWPQQDRMDHIRQCLAVASAADCWSFGQRSLRLTLESRTATATSRKPSIPFSAGPNWWRCPHCRAGWPTRPLCAVRCRLRQAAELWRPLSRDLIPPRAVLL